MKAQAFVIHLERAKNRKPQVERLLSRLPLFSTVIDAVDGSELAPETRTAVCREQINRPRFPFRMQNSEIGCFLSHRKAWQAIVDSGLEAGLIVEDDVDVDDSTFAGILDFVMKHLKKGDYVRFPYRSHTDKGPVVARQSAYSLVQPRLPGLGMQMQLVSREAAIVLLAKTKFFDRPVDSIIQLIRPTGIRVLAARPTGIMEISKRLGGTTVQKKNKSASEVLKREILRTVYRFSVRFRTFWM